MLNAILFSVLDIVCSIFEALAMARTVSQSAAVATIPSANSCLRACTGTKVFSVSNCSVFDASYFVLFLMLDSTTTSNQSAAAATNSVFGRQ